MVSTQERIQTAKRAEYGDVDVVHYDFYTVGLDDDTWANLTETMRKYRDAYNLAVEYVCMQKTSKYARIRQSAFRYVCSAIPLATKLVEVAIMRACTNVKNLNVAIHRNSPDLRPCDRKRIRLTVPETYGRQVGKHACEWDAELLKIPANSRPFYILTPKFLRFETVASVRIYTDKFACVLGLDPDNMLADNVFAMAGKRILRVRVEASDNDRQMAKLTVFCK